MSIHSLFALQLLLQNPSQSAMKRRRERRRRQRSEWSKREARNIGTV